VCNSSSQREKPARGVRYLNSGSRHSEGFATARVVFTLPGGPLDFAALGVKGQNVLFGATQRILLSALVCLAEDMPFRTDSPSNMSGGVIAIRG
jgi:hypothetical protein